MTEDEMREKVAKVLSFRKGRLTTYVDWHAWEDIADEVLSISLPWAREQALREAAEVARQERANATDDTQLATAYRICMAIKALIPARPSQTETKDAEV